MLIICGNLSVNQTVQTTYGCDDTPHRMTINVANSGLFLFGFKGSLQSFLLVMGILMALLTKKSRLFRLPSGSSDFFVA